MQYLKNTHFSHRIQFQTKKSMIYLTKMWKNQIFLIFFSKSILTSCLWLQIFQISGKKFQNWVALCFGRVLKIKVTKGELVISNCIEMADQYLLGGLEESPSPHWLGLSNCLSSLFLLFLFSLTYLFVVSVPAVATLSNTGSYFNISILHYGNWFWNLRRG